jgi:hypothetical protein
MFKVIHTEAAPNSSHEEFTRMQLLWSNLKELRECENNTYHISILGTELARQKIHVLKFSPVNSKKKNILICETEIKILNVFRF